MKMSRRKKSSSNGNKSNDDVAGEWSEEEKARLKDALKRDDGENNWRWIARQVKTKTVTQVKEYASKLNTGKQSVHLRASSASQQQSKSGKRPIAPKDDGPLEGWINATKRLRGENDLDGTCIPQIMTIAAMEPIQSDPGSQRPDYSQIYTLISRIMREQPLPNLSPLDARVILDLLNDLERRLAGLDISSQINFVVNKYREIMTTTSNEDPTSEGSQVPPNTAQGGSDANSRPKTQLFSLNPLNVPVELLNLKKQTPRNLSSQPPCPESAKDKQTGPPSTQ